MIKSANQHPVHNLLSPDGNAQYRVPPYQREYSWQKAQWEELFDDLVEADGSHFLGTIITLNRTVDAVDTSILELIDGQQRMTTLTLLMAAIYSVLHEEDSDDDDFRTARVNLRNQLIRKSDGQPRVVPQRQGTNLDDYHWVLKLAGLKVEAQQRNYLGLRRIYRCYQHFLSEIGELAEVEKVNRVDAALRVLDAVKRSIVVKIEVDNQADAFVLFESLNNRGTPLSPVDLIKNHLLAESERKGRGSLDETYGRWSDMLASLGDNYANQERFLRHYYNAFKADLPTVPNAPLATRPLLIRIYEALVERDIDGFLDHILPASEVYGRITGAHSGEVQMDLAFRQLSRAQGSPSYMLLLWLLIKRDRLGIDDNQIVEITDLLTSFFVRRNLTGHPQTYSLPRTFMSIIEKSAESDDVVKLVRQELIDISVDDETFLRRLSGPIYEENADVARFILATLSEDDMTRENRQDLWQIELKHYVWTIEHILPQGTNLPRGWIDMLGGPGVAADIQTTHVHRLGNLTITGYNANLGNKSFVEKRDRLDAKGRPIGYRNGIPLNNDLVDLESWTAVEIEERTGRLVSRTLRRFAL